MKRSLEADRRVLTDPSASLADALTVPRPGRNTFAIVQSLVDDVALVGEEAMRSAIRLLAIEEKLVVEAGGAVSVAAALAAAREAGDGPLVCVVSGGNIEPGLLREILSEPGEA